MDSISYTIVPDEISPAMDFETLDSEMKRYPHLMMVIMTIMIMMMMRKISIKMENLTLMIPSPLRM